MASPCLALVLCLLALVDVSQTHFDGVYTNGCCGQFLMDSDGRVFLETESPLVSQDGIFDHLKVKFCTTDRVFIQLWRQELDNTWRLEWQLEHLPTNAQIGIWNQLNVTRHELRSIYRLGVYGIDRNKISIPYDFRPNLPRVWTSENQVNGYSQVGESSEFDTQPWPRSFRAYILFCNDFECLNDQSNPPAVISGPTGPIGPIGPVGPEGPRGLPGPPGDGGFECAWDDPDGPVVNIDNKITVVDNKVNELQETINSLQTAINRLNSGNFVTGTCPSGFEAGSYGVGFCYLFIRDPKMSLGEAQIHCWDFYEARLVDVVSDLEERYIVNHILSVRKGGNYSESFWTSGMYSPAIKRWVWWEERTAIRRDMTTYLNWATGQPADFNGKNNCMVLTVDAAGQAAWYARDCPLRHYFICKLPKRCL